MLSNKGQSALEYLMTYGWALVVIIIVIAALFAFGIFNPPSAGTCTGLDKFLYKDHSVSAGVITLVLGNGTGSTIGTISATYGSDFSTAGPDATNPVLPTTVTAGQDFTVLSNALGPANGSGGYTGTITIAYTNNTSGLQHTETATCTGSV